MLNGDLLDLLIEFFQITHDIRWVQWLLLQKAAIHPNDIGEIVWNLIDKIQDFTIFHIFEFLVCILYGVVQIFNYFFKIRLECGELSIQIYLQLLFEDSVEGIQNCFKFF